MTHTDELHLAELLRRLPPAPAAWVRAAQELPLVRGRLDGILARAEADGEFRRALTDDPERALAGAGFEPERALVAVLRARLSDA
jgi:hypothetical protein